MHHLPCDSVIFLNANQIIALLAYNPLVPPTAFQIENKFSFVHKIFYDLTLVNVLASSAPFL